MTITSVDVMRLKNGKSCIATVPWEPICIRVNTDEGICGFGEAGLAYGNASNAAYGILEDFAKLIIGQDPMRNEAIWNMFHRKTFWGMGNGAVVSSGMSAIDIALWDIKGKALGVPVYELLGGKTNSRLRSYASQLQFDWDEVSRPMITPDDYARAMHKAIADGYDCVKVDPIGQDEHGVWMGGNTYGLLSQRVIDMAVQRVSSMRQVAGDNIDIIIELHSLTDTNTAIQLGYSLEPYHCFYYEEPTQPLNPMLMDKIAQKLRIPLASGERIYSRWGFRPFLENRSLSIIQPDLGNTGGITEGKKICDMAHIYDIGVQIHVCGGPIATAAALQLEAVIPNFVVHEHHAAALLKENRALCKYDYQPVGGYFEIPSLPGLGQELTDETIALAEKITVSR